MSAINTPTYDPALESEPVEMNQLNDDEDIFLSDLVRTGEASRLRRRGAMRVEHPSRPAVVRETVDSYAIRTDAEEDATGDKYILYCGHEGLPYQFSDYGEEKPFEPSVLPCFPESSQRVEPEQPPSNGCGTLVHTGAVPRRSRGEWTARGSATDAVVHLDPSCFEHKGRAKKYACGCIWECVGCSVCGNSLGTLHKPCPTASSASSSPTSARRVSLNTAPPSSSYIYTFSSTTVTSSPPFHFPRSSTPPPPLIHFPVTPINTTPPRTQNDDDEDVGNYDRDGELIPTEPNSPADKPGNEAMLWPER